MEHCDKLAFLSVIFGFLCVIQGWSGPNVCTQVIQSFRNRQTCIDPKCWWTKTVSYPVYEQISFCCTGWTHNGNEICNIALCSPQCQNNGTCIAPNRCHCRVQNTGDLCDGSTCSHLSPCYPGTCQRNNNCDCMSGFQTSAGINSEFCLKMNQNMSSALHIYQMRARLSYWPRAANPSYEKEFFLADSTNFNNTDMDIVWTNMRQVNRLDTNCTSSFTPTLPPKPSYIGDTAIGIVKGEVEATFSKLSSGQQNRTIFLVAPFNCTTRVSDSLPERSLYNCDIVNEQFLYNLEHGDFLTFTFKTKAGGFRELLDLNKAKGSQLYKTQFFDRIERKQSVQFRFDFNPPEHCHENASCRTNGSMLSVQDITKTELSIAWSGWYDNDSGLRRFAVEVFKMTKTIQNELEIRHDVGLRPLYRTEINSVTNLQPLLYTPPMPGAYSIVLEAADFANNTKYVRRLCLYDPSSVITTDPVYALFVTSASEAGNYTYQTNQSLQVVVTWDRHFRNSFHEENAILGKVLRFPTYSGEFKKDIPPNLDDNDGQRTIDEIPNNRGITNFELAYSKKAKSGINSSSETTVWNNVFLNTNFTLPLTPNDTETIIIWIKATDAMANTKVESTKVTFDFTPPEAEKPDVKVNQPGPNGTIVSRFVLIASDLQSGIAHVTWKFFKTGTTVFQEKIPVFQTKDCIETTSDNKLCYCTLTSECFLYDQSYSLDNCHLVSRNGELSQDVVTVAADVTNKAGLVIRTVSMTLDLKVLNCVQPNSSSADNSVGIYVGIAIGAMILIMLALLVVVFVLWKKGRILQAPGVINTQLRRMNTVYNNARRRSQMILGRHTYRSRNEPREDRGVSVNTKPLRVSVDASRISRCLRTYLENVTFSCADEGDDIYVSASKEPESAVRWEINHECLTLQDKVAEGKFAAIFLATWDRSNGQTETVALKMLKANYTQDDKQKMKEQIHFSATMLEDHDNVLKFIGAVTFNDNWGPVLVMEYCERGQLDKWLRDQRSNVTEAILDNLFQFSLGVSKGMEYLASKKVTHKRLAARNILLTSQLEVKVAGFGPRHHKEHEGDKMLKIPVKWAAPEVLAEKPPTEKSDVWSYGILLWEIYSMGEIPYSNIHADQIAAKLKKGDRLERPEYADDTMYMLMSDCWRHDPDKRPTFSSVRVKLTQVFCPDRSSNFYYDNMQLKANNVDK